MTRRPLGAACVVGADGGLTGLITDGDLRRALTNHDDIRGLCAADVMTMRPVTISPSASLGAALDLMERRESQISVLAVVDSEGHAAGLLRLHDVFRGAR
jgi:arabinose-5-phosphate isomerase